MTPETVQRHRSRTIVDFLRPHWIALTLALLAVVGGSAADLAQPWPLKIVLDYLLQSKKPPTWLAVPLRWIGPNKLAVLNFAVLAVAVIAIVGAISSYLENYLTTSVGQSVMHDLRRTLYHHIHRLSLAEHDEKRTGDLIGRVTTDIEAIQAFITTALLGILSSVLTLVGIIGIMVYKNWRFTLISLAIAPVLFLVVYIFTRRIKKASRAVRKKESELLSIVQEVFSSIRVVKAFAREDYEERRFECQSLENVETALAARNLKGTLAPIVDILVAIGTCLMLGYGARLVLAGQLTAGDLVVFLLYLAMMYKPMRDLSKMTDTVSKAEVGFDRIREVLETESGMRDLSSARRAGRFKGKIEFDKVSFGYSHDQLILKDMSFAIEPGQVAAFVGPTGGCRRHTAIITGFWIDSEDRNRMINGNDGGATISVDGGKNWSTLYNQPTAQFYHVAADNDFLYKVYGAQQDNTTIGILSRTDEGYIGRQHWFDAGGGESGYIAPDPRDSNIIYAWSGARLRRRRSPAAPLAVEIAANSHEVRQLPTEHHLQSRPVSERGIRRLDPGITPLRLAEDNSQRLVDAHEVREPRLGVSVDPADLARFPAAIRSNRQVQQGGRLFVRDRP